MSISLSTETTKCGIQLRHKDGSNAGIIEAHSVELNGIRWRFVFPGALIGKSRVSIRAAEYDALAYWEEEHAK